MFLLRPLNFVDISIDLNDVVYGVIWLSIGKTLDYAWKKLQIPIKSKNLYYNFRSLKYQFLYNYEGWKITQKRKGSWFLNYPMSKKELQYFTQMLFSSSMTKPDLTKDEKSILLVLLKSAYPEKFKEVLGETKSEIQARLNIEKFFRTTFT